MKFNYIKLDNETIPIYTQDNKSDTTIVFLHGINSSSDFMKKLIDLPHKYNIVAPNLPGSKYFRDVLPEEINMPIWIKYVQKIIENIKTKHIYVLAHSMAGGIGAKIVDNPRINKIIMMSTINPAMVNTSSYSFLMHTAKTANENTNKLSWLGNVITKVASWFKKTQPLIDGFTRKGNWYNIIENTVLNNKYLAELDKDYRRNKDKLIFVISQKDNIIGTKYFEEYARALQKPVTIIGQTHSPIKNDPITSNNFINSIVSPKKRWFWQRFITFRKNIIEINKDDADEKLMDELEKEVN